MSSKDVFIPRTQLLAKLSQHRDTEPIKVLTGVRRCGKSTLLQMFVQQLKDEGVSQDNIFAKRFDSFDIPLGYNASNLYEDLQNAFKHANSAEPFYVFLDEIQDVDGWERVVRRLHTRPNTDVYITGSNSQLLSGDLATYLAGRYAEIPVFPLSFEEYAHYRNASESQTTIAQDFADYMRYGGMPGLYKQEMPSLDTVREQLDGIYDSVVVKDVAERNNIRDLGMLNTVCKYLFSTSGTLFSTRNVSNTLTSAGTPANVKTVDTYIQALERAYIVYRAEQVGISGKKILRPTNKYYPVDNGFRNLANGFRTSDLGAQLEGIVFLELKRRGYTINVGNNGSEEVDFVAERSPNRAYIQVTLSMLDDATRERELRPLQKLNDAFPRIVLTLDGWNTGTDEQGIQIVPVTDWLLNKNHIF